MSEFPKWLKENTQIPWRDAGKLRIPPEIQHVKLDVGLSYNAPMSQYWLTHEDNVLVFGFEPNPASVQAILHETVKRHPSHGDILDKKYIGTQFHLIPCALGLAADPTVKFYVTSGDGGCSSLYSPKDFAVEKVIDVPIFPLAHFLELMPWDTHPVIDYIKIDAQGADLDIIKSAGPNLAKHVIYITLEPEDKQYTRTNNSIEAIEVYMQSLGFIRVFGHPTSDPTYLNSRYAEYIKTHPICIYQKG